jgi:hypothetical protein
VNQISQIVCGARRTKGKEKKKRLVALAGIAPFYFVNGYQQSSAHSSHK